MQLLELVRGRATVALDTVDLELLAAALATAHPSVAGDDEARYALLETIQAAFESAALFVANVPEQ